MNPEVNSPYIEAGPMVTKDGKRLYFSRQGDPANLGGPSDQDIWYSTFDDATQLWLPAVNLGAPLNNKGPNFLCGVGWKGDTVLCGNVYLKNGKMKAGISVSIRVGDVWSFPVPVFLNNDYNFANQVDYDLSHDRKALVISQQKDDSNGGTDLYVAFRDETAKETYAGTESINLGPIINSPGNENAPFLSYDGKTCSFRLMDIKVTAEKISSCQSVLTIPGRNGRSRKTWDRVSTPSLMIPILDLHLPVALPTTHADCQRLTQMSTAWK